VTAYTETATKLISGIHASSDDPLIIESLEMTNDKGDCLKILDSENIIIRGNYIHDCTGGDYDEMGNPTVGRAIYIENSKNITIEDNKLDNNAYGILIESSQGLEISSNEIKNTKINSSLKLFVSSNGRIYKNTLTDNGSKEDFWIPGNRNIGILLEESDDIDVFENTVTRSSSDGISAIGNFLDDKKGTGYSENIRIHNNTILDNMEQGVWLIFAKNIQVYENNIRTGCYTPGAGVFLELNVSGSEIYNNIFTTCMVPSQIVARVSYNNKIYSNQAHTLELQDEFVNLSESSDDEERCRIAGIKYISSFDNEVYENTFDIYRGELYQQLKCQLIDAQHRRTAEGKGRFNCKVTQMNLADECDRDATKQDLSSDGLGLKKFGESIYEDCMDNFEKYTKEEPEEDKTTADLNNKSFIYGILTVLSVASISLVTATLIIRYRGKKRRAKKEHTVQ
jgi:parallel beta-helix repeat protein